MTDGERAVLKEVYDKLKAKREARWGNRSVWTIPSEDLSIWQGLSEAMLVVEEVMDPEAYKRKRDKEFARDYRIFVGRTA